MGAGPIRHGVLLAVLAAASFGATTPVLRRASAGVGPFTAAALLYLGAALMSLPAIGRWRSSGLRRGDAPWLAIVALAGAALAPAALVWGLARTSGLTASLLLNVEALFTVVLAKLIYGEHVGRRVTVALVAMAIAGAILVTGEGGGGIALSTGAAAVLAATFLWAVDNALTRRLADRDAAAVVLAKASVGVVISVLVVQGRGESAPGVRSALAIVACGAFGYGLSLRLYVLAQRRLGAGRTGSIFAVGPFIGAALAPLLGDPLPNATALLAGGLFAVGLCLHLTERHGHPHRHEPVEHDHVHGHDDGHHDHPHDPPVTGEHAHPHRHEGVEHEHEHAPDLHHRHGH